MTPPLISDGRAPTPEPCLDGYCRSPLACSVCNTAGKGTCASGNFHLTPNSANGASLLRPERREGMKMLGKHKFKVGQRVKPSEEGRARTLFKDKHKKGTVVRVDEFNCPTVLWDHRKTASGYHPDFIEPVRPSKERE